MDDGSVTGRVLGHDATGYRLGVELVRLGTAATQQQGIGTR